MNQKGFLGLLVTVIIAVIAVVGAGSYFVLQRGSVKSELSQPQNLDDGQAHPPATKTQSTQNPPSTPAAHRNFAPAGNWYPSHI